MRSILAEKTSLLGRCTVSRQSKKCGTEASAPWPHLHRDLSARRWDWPVIRTEATLMKAFAAALFAAVILYAVDTEYNDGRYTQIVAQAVRGLVSR
jgi:hypothetical protein